MSYYALMTGERIMLSPLDPDDAELFCRWMNDPAILARLGRNADGGVTAARQRAWMSAPERAYDFAIVRRSDGRAIGQCGLHGISWHNRKAELSILLGDEAVRGQGYGGEAVRLLEEYAFLQMGLNSLELCVFESNTRAIACYEKAGFVRYGLRHQCDFVNGAWENDVLMELLRADWTPLPAAGSAAK